jgi:hypothetical protein
MRRPIEAYHNQDFLHSRSARALRILAEYIEPQSRFEHFRVDDTIVVTGSARFVSREQAEAQLRAAEAGEGDLEQTRMQLDMSQYYEAARELARRLTAWSQQLYAQVLVCLSGEGGDHFSRWLRDAWTNCSRS